jgi:hypothetical protein
MREEKRREEKRRNGKRGKRDQKNREQKRTRAGRGFSDKHRIKCHNKTLSFFPRMHDPLIVEHFSGTTMD